MNKVVIDTNYKDVSLNNGKVMRISTYKNHYYMDIIRCDAEAINEAIKENKKKYIPK